MKIGPKMQAAVEFAARNPGVTKSYVAEHVRANQPMRHGYAIVDRAIKARLIEANGKGNAYILTVR